MKCKYCGKTLLEWEKGTMCTSCARKIKRVRELVEICRRIKEKAGKK